MSLTKAHVLDALRSIRDASSAENLVSLGLVTKCAACDGYVSLTIACPDDGPIRRKLERDVRDAVETVSNQLGVELHQCQVQFVEPTGSETPRPEYSGPPEGVKADGSGDRDDRGGADGRPPSVEQPRTIPLKQAASSRTTEQGSTKADSPIIPGVKHVVAVGAGKGGVGKSTVATNLAVGLARLGHAVGLLDADIYGPSLPTLMGLHDLETLVHQNKMQVFYVHGVKTMTIGKLVDPEKPLIWRGPMAHGAFKQLAEQTDWGELDYLIIDLPPGTGDVPLTMSQLLSLTGAVVVCTPQRVAQDDAVRAVRMFQQLKIDVLGIVENMSYFIGDDGKEYDIFGRGGAEIMAQRLGLPFLGAVPLNMALRHNSDQGAPVENFESAGDQMRRALETMVKQIEAQSLMAAGRVGMSKPELSVS
jgi:ATP-binding protein involved in chromosome partitioning